MSWQEELRKLDEELASGRLSADDYRVRRDQVLSSAVAQGEDPAGATPQAEQPAQPAAQPEQPAQQDDAQQQGQAQQAGQPQQPQQQPAPGQQTGGPVAESTQVISPTNMPNDPGAERTQVVPPWQAQQAQQAAQAQQPQQPFTPQQGPASPAGGFQPVNQPQGFPQNPNSPAGGFQQQTPWNAADADQSPPWGGSDFPPIAPPSSNEWAAQGPEGFEDKNSGGKGKIFGIVGAIVVVIALGVGAFLIWGTGGDEQQNAGGQNGNNGGQQSQQAPTSAPAGEGGGLEIGQMDGQAESHDDIKTYDDVASKYLTAEEQESYEKTDPGAAKFGAFHLDNGDLVVVLLTEIGDPGAATDELSNLTQITVTNGAKRVTGNGIPDDVYLTQYENKDDKSIQMRGHYISDSVLVRIEVNNKTGDADTAMSEFNDALKAQQQVLPVG